MFTRISFRRAWCYSCLLIVPHFGAAQVPLSESGRAKVRHAPTINGAVDGSIHQMTGEPATLNGAAAITGDLFVPGTPEVRVNGRPAYAGTVDGSGGASPANYQITLNGGARLRHIVRRTDPVVLPPVPAPPQPTGTRSVVIASNGRSPGDFSTLRSLTLNAQVGQFAIPPGTYGDVTVNGGSGLTLGIAGATQPSIYNVQRLTFNGHSHVQVIGPVILNVAHGFTGNGILGTTANPAWLTINLYSGGLTLNGGATLHGFVNVPSGTVVVNGNSQLIGGVTCDRLIVNGAGFLRLIGAGSSNRPPIVSEVTGSLAEDTSTTITLAATDADGDPLAFSVVTPPAAGTLSTLTPGANYTASVIYTPKLNRNGTDTFTFKANDGALDSLPATVRLEITPVNDQPISEPKVVTVDEDNEVNIVLIGTDVDGDTLFYTVITPPTRGLLSVIGAQVVYQPALNYHGPDAFSYVSSDGALTSQPADVRISVAAVNDAPVALASSYSVNEGASVAIRLTGTDVDGDALAFERLTAPLHGVLSGDVPHLTYRPDLNYNGIDSFLFRVSDGSVQSAIAAVTIHVTDLNVPPVAQNATARTDEDISVEIELLGADGDGDALGFFIVTPPVRGVLGPLRPGLSGTHGTVVYTPNLNYHGTDGFTFKVRDATGADSNVASVVVAVSPINDPPVANGQVLKIDEDGNVTVVLTGTDPENSALTFSVSKSPAHGTLGALVPGPVNSATITYRPDADYHGEDAFSFTAHDGEIGSWAGTILLTVRPINDAPMADGQSIALTEDQPRALTLSGHDVEGSALTFVVLIPPVHGTLGLVETASANTASVTYLPGLDYHGSDSFTFEVSDGERVSIPALVALEIAAVDDPPIAVAQSFVQSQDTAFRFTLTATDADNDPITYQILTYPTRGVLSGVAPNFTYTPQSGDRGTVTLTFTATDGRLTSEAATITFTMMAVNQAPVAMAVAPVTLDEDSTAAVTLVGSDFDGDGLRFQVLDHPTGGSLGVIAPAADNTATVLYTPTPNEFGTDSFSFWVSDGARDSNRVTVSLVIRPVNDVPIAAAQAFTLSEDATVGIVLAATDADGDLLSYVVLTPPANGSLTGVAPHLTYFPALNYSGSDGFTWSARDPSLGESGPATVSLLILPVNDAPIATSAEVGTDEDVPVRITLTGSDVDSTVLTYRILTPPRYGTLSGVIPHLTYTPEWDFAGSDRFTFKVTDGALADSDVATVAIVVRPVDDPPVVNAGADQAVMLPAYASLVGVVTDPDGPIPVLTWSMLSGSAAVEFENADAAVTRVAFPAAGIYTLRLTATSGGGSVSDDIRVTVSASTLAFRTYTTSADFALGSSSNVSTAVSDQLQLRDEAAPGNFIWVAVSSKGTIVKINTRTGKVEGEYKTAPDGQPRDPSRTTVDLQGAVWVANRAGNSIVQIGSVESGLWIDKNGNGQPDTSIGLGDIRGWSNVSGSDTDGGILTAEDECIIRYVRVSASGTRHLSVDPRNNIWVSGVSGAAARTFDLVDGRTGLILRREGPVGYGAYGGLIDRSDVLWSATAGSLLRWETRLPLSGPNGESWSTLAGSGNLYGLALGPDGYVWCSTAGAGLVHKYAPSGVLVASYGQGHSQAQGLVVDHRGHVWIAHGLSASTVGHLRSDGTFLGNVTVGSGPTGVAVDADGKIWATNHNAGTVSRIDPDSGPVGSDGVTPIGTVDYTTAYLGGTVYNYSDMTGNNLSAPPLAGVWTVIYDSEKPATHWGSINWHAQIVDDGKLGITVASSSDGIAFSPWRTGVRGVDLDVPSGRYLKVNVLMQRSSSGYSPSLHDLTIGEQGYLPAYPFNQVPVIEASGFQVAADGVEARLSAKVMDDGLPHPSNLSYTWSKLSGPGAVSFDEPTRTDAAASFSEKGSYILRLSATDGAGRVDRDVTVLANTPPTANAGPDLRGRNAGSTLVLRGSTYDDAANSGTFITQWRQIAGPAVATFADGASPTSSVTFPAVGTYVLELSADDGWAVSRDTVTVRVGPLSSPDAPTDMALYWPFDEGSVDVVRGQVARLWRGASLSQAQVARGVHLDGIDDFASIIAHSDHDLGSSSAGMTIEFWFQPQVNRDGMILSWGEAGTPGLAVYQTDAGRELEVNFRERANGGDRGLRTVGRLMVPGQWVHLAITHDRSTGTAVLYIDGNVHRTAAVGSAAVRTQFPLVLGRAAWDGTSHWAGVLDEVAFFHRPLGFAEVNALFANGTVGRNSVAAGLAPVANAGPEVRLRSISEIGSLAGIMTDDSPVELKAAWSVMSAPAGGQVQFAAGSAAATTATFSAPGTYLLKLDGEDFNWMARPDFVAVRVATTAAEPSAGLVAWWPADGSVHEVIGGTAKVELLQGASFGPGRVMQAFYFDGVDDHGRIKASADIDVGASASGMTIEFWVKPTALRDGSILSWGAPGLPGVSIYQYDAGRAIDVNLRDRTSGADWVASTGRILIPGAWTHYAVTYDRPSTWVTVYVNGIVVRRTQLPSREVRTQYDLVFGRNAWDPGAAWSGAVDEVTLYQRALTQAELARIVEAGVDGKLLPGAKAALGADAGPDLDLVLTGVPVALGGAITGEGRAGGVPAVLWSVKHAPDSGLVNFSAATNVATGAVFSTPGLYVLQLSVRDGIALPISDTKEVRVGVTHAAEPLNGISAWWSGNGHPREMIQGGQDIRFVNPEGYAAGKVSQGFVFGAVANGRAEVPAHPQHDIGGSDTGFSIEFWMQPAALSDGMILSWGAPNLPGLAIYQHDGGRAIDANLRERHTGGDWSITTPRLLAAGTWSHYTLTHDPGANVATVYLNGVVVRRSSLPARAIRTQYDLSFGRNAWDQSFGWSGVLDEVTLYRRALSQAEVIGQYQAGSFGKTLPHGNRPPVVDAGPDLDRIPVGTAVSLAGVVQDDNLPFGPPAILWTMTHGPGAVTFANATAANTAAVFDSAGLYILKLAAHDGLNAPVSGTREVRVGITNSAEPSSGIVAWWPGNGHPREIIQGGHDVQFVNGEGFAAGRVSQGFYFHAVGNGRAEVSAAPAIDIGASAAGFTVEFWAQPSQLSDGAILSWGAPNTPGLTIYQIDAGRSIEANLRERATGADWSIRTPVGLTAGTWIHYALTFDRVSEWATLYLNGLVVRRAPLPARAVATQHTLSFGRNAWDQAFGWKGILDEVALYNRPLSQSELQGIFLSGAFGKIPPDDNLPPVVDAGPDLNNIVVGNAVLLRGMILDDGRPNGAPVSKWSVLHAPATAVVTFADGSSPTTTATFSAAGLYRLQLTVTDGLTLPVADAKEVRVGLLNTVAPPSGIAAWWSGNGHPRELIHGGHDIQFVNPEGYVAGRVAQGFYFNATNEGRADVPAHSDLDIGASETGFSIEFWLKPTAVADGLMLSWGAPGLPGLAIYQYDAGRAIQANLRERVSGADFGLTTPHVIVAGGWTHYVLTYDRIGAVARAYINGALVTSGDLPSRAVRTQYQLSLGRNAWDPGSPWRGVLDEISLYKRPLSAAEIMGLFQAGEAGKAPPASAYGAPIVAMVEPSPGTAVGIGKPVILLALAADSDGGISRVEFFDGEIKLGETSVAEPGRPTAFAFTLGGGFTTLGRHTVRARAIDPSGLGTWSEAVVLEVAAVLPSVAITTPLNHTVVGAGSALTLEANASYPLGAIVRVEFYNGSSKLGEAIVGSGSSFRLTLANGLAPGVHSLKARAVAQDGRAAFSAGVSVTAAADTTPPVVVLTAPVAGATIYANQTLTMTALATDADGSIAKVEFYVGPTKIGEDATFPYSTTLVEGLSPGSYSLRARATDNGGLSTFSEAVTVATVTSAPVLAALLSAPLDDTRITGPISVTGVVGSAALQSWAIDYRLKTAEGVPGEPWISAATGTAPVGTPAAGSIPAIPGVLGTFDPTRLINGIYELQLRATQTTGVITTVGPIPVLVEGNMKIGAFSVAFEDLKIPVAGIPITITRMYDSRDVRVGDFGPGWRLGLNTVRVQKNRHLGNAWWQTPQSGSGIQFYDVLPQRDRVVSVVMPDGVTHRFRAGALVKNRDGDPDDRSFAVVVKRGKYRFYPIGDTTSVLEPLDTDNQLAEDFYIGGTNEQDLSVDEFGFQPFNPSRYRLTIADGTRYTLDEAIGLIELRDLDGNSLLLNRDAARRVTGVTTTQNAAGGAITRSISIIRDGSGRVDYIRDLAGKDLDYIYDGQGRLEAFVDRGNQATQFRYENPLFPYYLTRIVDPRGVAALRNEYDGGGKLISQTDADGKVTVFARGLDATGRFEKVTDRLGHATTFYYNERGDVTLKIDPLGAETRFDYWPDSERLKFETDHYGNVKASAYDVRGNVIVETTGASRTDDPANPLSGYVSRTLYNARGGPTQMTDAAGRVQTFAYDPVTNNVLSHTAAPDAVNALPGDRTIYTYHPDGSPHTITDALGNVTSHSYEYGLADAAYPAAVKRTVVTVVDPAGVSGSDRENVTPTVLRTTRAWFDVQENQIASEVSRIQPDGAADKIVTRNFFDAENRVRATLLPDGRVTETRYNTFGAQEKTVWWRTWGEFAADPRDDFQARVTSYGYDARGNQILVTHPDGATGAAGFDLENRKIWSQDRRGQRTYFVYDAGGRLRLTIYPDANDGLGGAAPTSDADPRLADNPRDETRYDLIGRVRFQIDARNATTEFTYADGTGEPMLRTQSLQHHSGGNLVTRYEYDRTGNVRFVTDPQGNTVETRYDDRGRPVQVLLPATDQHPVTQRETRYDGLGRRVAIVDEEGRIARYRYDAIGRLTEVRQYLDSALAASDVNLGLLPGTTGVVSTRYGYDAAGNQQTQTDALGRVTTYWTDQLGRRTRRVLPKDSSEATTLVETLTYDAWGNLWRRTDFAGHTATFAYDRLNRMISKTADVAHPSLAFSHAITRVEYDYDANGARTAARTFNATNVPLYVESTPRDERGRLTRKDTALGRLDYTYYRNGLLKDVVSSNTAGVNIGYRYDALNRLEWVDDTSTGLPTRTTGYVYTANGSLASVAQPNGVGHAYAYDPLNRLRTVNVARAATQLHRYDYKLNRSGHRQQIVEGAKTTTYTYDELDRLTTEVIAGDAAGNNGVVGYSLDKTGNRLARSSGLVGLTAQTGLSYNARDWLSGDTYTANGSTLSSTHVAALNAQVAGTDTYDFEERLILRMRPDGTTINLSYDADGHRTGKSILSASSQPLSATSWLVDTNNLTGYAQVFEEQISSAAGTTRRIYTHGSDLISQATAMNAQSWEYRYFSYDGHGSTRELTDHLGAVTDRYDYDAFGFLIRRNGATSNAYLYCGEQFDADLGLYYLRARYLNPDSGRFWSMDDFEGRGHDPASLHKYLYAHGDPVMFSDPSGQSVVSLTYHLTLQVSMRIWAIAPAFAAGAAAVGRAYNALGSTVQSGAWQVALRFPQLTVSPEQWISARSRLDLVLELGRRVAIIESKYKIPLSGEALTRMTKQLSDALASGRGEVVLFVVKQPTAAEMAKVPTGVRVVVGYHDLAIWIERSFGITPH